MNPSAKALISLYVVRTVLSWSLNACAGYLSSLAMLLQILQLLCPPENKLPQSVYILKKFFQKYSSKSTKVRFCGSCNQELQEKQLKCSNIQCEVEPSTLIVIRPDKAIKRILTSKFDLYLCLWQAFKSRDLNNRYVPTPEVCMQYIEKHKALYSVQSEGLVDNNFLAIDS